VETFEEIARETDIIVNRARAMFGDPPLPLREYGIEAEFTVRDAVQAELATASLIPAELMPPERATSGYDPRRSLRE
jgi:hypothetical protein